MVCRDASTDGEGQAAGDVALEAVLANVAERLTHVPGRVVPVAAIGGDRRPAA